MGERALYEQVAERLRSRIVAHTLGPGSWIDEQSLAAEYGISRTPLREALKVLAAEGLVTMKLRRGAYVTEVSARDLAEVYHLLAPGARGPRRRSRPLLRRERTLPHQAARDRRQPLAQPARR
jgi:DNA-binding FadR family transcriptional regulator